jgi:hypothetical protein
MALRVSRGRRQELNSSLADRTWQGGKLVFPVLDGHVLAKIMEEAPFVGKSCDWIWGRKAGPQILKGCA